MGAEKSVLGFCRQPGQGPEGHLHFLSFPFYVHPTIAYWLYPSQSTSLSTPGHHPGRSVSSPSGRFYRGA